MMTEETNPVLALAPDRMRCVVSGSDEHTIKCWHTATSEVQAFPTGARVRCPLPYLDLPVVIAGLWNGRILVLAIEPDVAGHDISPFHTPAEPDEP